MHKQCSPNFEHYRWNKFLKHYCSRKTHLADSVEFTRLPSKVKQAEEVPKAVNFTSYCLRRRTLNTIQGGLNEQLCTPVIFSLEDSPVWIAFINQKKLISEPLSLQSTCFTDMIYLLTTLLLIMMIYIYISLQFLGVFKHLHELTIQLNLSHRDTRPNSRNEYTVQVQLRYCYVRMHYWFWILLHNVWVAFWVGKDDVNLKLWLAAGWYCSCLKYYVELSLI